MKELLNNIRVLVQRFSEGLDQVEIILDATGSVVLSEMNDLVDELLDSNNILIIREQVRLLDEKIEELEEYGVTLHGLQRGVNRRKLRLEEERGIVIRRRDTLESGGKLSLELRTDVEAKLQEIERRIAAEDLSYQDNLAKIQQFEVELQEMEEYLATLRRTIVNWDTNGWLSAPVIDGPQAGGAEAPTPTA